MNGGTAPGSDVPNEQTHPTVSEVASSEVTDQLCPYPVVSSTCHYHGRVIDLYSDEVDLSAPGEEAGTQVVRRDYVHHPGAVAIVALRDSAVRGQPSVLLLRQYRHPVASLMWEIPAGLLDVEGESLLQAAQRELFEEAALVADTWQVLTDFYNTPGSSDEKVRIFLARDVHEVPADQRHQGQAEERDMPTAWLPLSEAVSAVSVGQVNNATAIIGVLTTQLAYQAQWSPLLPTDHPWHQPGHHWAHRAPLASPVITQDDPPHTRPDQ